MCEQWHQFATNTAYYAVKELVMTERTYKKDLEIIAVVCITINFLLPSDFVYR